MSAVWAKNEPTAAKRRVAMMVFKADLSPAPRGTDFQSFSAVQIAGTTAPDFKFAAGTMTNQRVLISVGSFDFTAEADDDTITAVGHGLETGDGPFVVDAVGGGSALPGGLFSSTPYWIIRIDDDTFQVADTLAHAYLGTEIDLTTDGSPTLTMSMQIVGGSAITRRGLDGHFVYEATQAETQHSGNETIVIVHSLDDPDYDRNAGGGGREAVAMTNSADDFGSAELENGLTRDDAFRILLRSLAAKFSRSGNDYQFRDMADSKDSHHGTVTSAGRIDADIDDAT